MEAHGILPTVFKPSFTPKLAAWTPTIPCGLTFLEEYASPVLNIQDFFTAMPRRSSTNAITTNNKRLSTGRSVKPKRAFSPEPLQAKKPEKERIAPIVPRKHTEEQSARIYVDSMRRSELLHQLSQTLETDFEWPLLDDNKLMVKEETIGSLTEISIDQGVLEKAKTLEASHFHQLDDEIIEVDQTKPSTSRNLFQSLQYLFDESPMKPTNVADPNHETSFNETTIKSPAMVSKAVSAVNGSLVPGNSTEGCIRDAIIGEPSTSQFADTDKPLPDAVVHQAGEKEEEESVICDGSVAPEVESNDDADSVTFLASTSAILKSCEPCSTRKRLPPDSSPERNSVESELSQKLRELRDAVEAESSKILDRATTEEPIDRQRPSPQISSVVDELPKIISIGRTRGRKRKVPIKIPMGIQPTEETIKEDDMDFEISQNVQESPTSVARPEIASATRTPAAPVFDTPPATVSASGRPQRSRSKPLNTDYYYPTLMSTASLLPTYTKESVSKASTSTQKTISLVTTPNAVILPQLASSFENAAIQPESAPAVPGADKSPLLTFAATLSPKRRNTEGGMESNNTTKDQEQEPRPREYPTSPKRVSVDSASIASRKSTDVQNDAAEEPGNSAIVKVAEPLPYGILERAGHHEEEESVVCDGSVAPDVESNDDADSVTFLASTSAISKSSEPCSTMNQLPTETSPERNSVESELSQKLREFRDPIGIESSEIPDETHEPVDRQRPLHQISSIADEIPEIVTSPESPKRKKMRKVSIEIPSDVQQSEKHTSVDEMEQNVQESSTSVAMPEIASAVTTSAAPVLGPPPMSASGRPQRIRSTPLNTDYYYPTLMSTASLLPTYTKESVSKASTSAQKTISLVTSPNAVISAQVTSPSTNVPKQPDSAPAVPVADKSPLLSLAASLSPKRRSTESGVDTIKPTKHEQHPRPKKAARGSVGSRPAPVAHHRQSAPNPFSEPLTINTNIANARRSSVSRQLLSIHTPSTPATASPRSGHQRYPVYGVTDVPHNKPDAPLDFFSRMQERRRLNTLAIGLHGSSKKGEDFGKKYTDEYYYREILMRPTPNGSQTPGSEEESVDVTSFEDEQFPNDEVLTSSPAESCAQDVLRTLKSAFSTTSDLDWESANGEDVDDNPGQDISNTVMEKAAQVPRDVFEHLQQMLKYIFVQRLTDLSTQNVVAGSSMLYSSSLTNANRLRESLKLFSKQRLASVVVAHIWLLRNLNVPLLAAYLNLLRFLKVAGSSLSQHLVDSCTKDPDLERATEFIKEFLAPKMYDPPTSSLSRMMSCERIQNVSLVLVYPQITTEFYHHTIRSDWLFRHLLPRIAQCVEKVDLKLKTSKFVSVESCTLQCLQLIQRRVREIVKRRPHDHIFLAGWGTSCLLNHKVVTEVPGVSGMLNFAFPVLSAAGPRGEVDDDICLTYCPSLFVVGEYAADVELEAMQNMRRNMIVDNGLIVVGGANHNLLVSHHKLNIERVSQKCVERTIVEHAMEFMKQVMNDLGPARECREMLRPVTLPNIYEVDVAAMRCKPNPAAPGTSRPKKSQANPQTGLKQSVMKEFVSIPSSSQKSGPSSLHISTHASIQTPLASPLSLKSYGGLSTPSATSPYPSGSTTPGSAPLASARNSLNNILLTKRVSNPVQIPTPSMLNQQLPPPLPTDPSMIGNQDESRFDDHAEQMRREEELAAAALMEF
ncbi:protein sumv-2 [Ditylenchus destructor]|uniref:Protein sumv-2 n=1 Tax=Ditylenchus destructor TaxID=166010 RepID=A0AAD4MUL6_9BILA|nr:protein sumv-2 [Ditylenchus destructor]